MQREACVELSHLPKLNQSIKSINFRRTTPGSVSHLAFSARPPPAKNVLDPSHPALAYNGAEWNRAFKWWRSQGFSIRAFPKGLLAKPDPFHPDPPYSLNEGPRKGHSLNMSLLDCAPKSVGGRVVRQEILRKFKTAISLIVVRGADVVQDEDGNPRLVFRTVTDATEEDGSYWTDEEDETVDQADTIAGIGTVVEAMTDAEDRTKPEARAMNRRDERWILSDWTYLIRPELEVYGMSYVKLIPSVRDALQRILATGLRLEDDWVRATVKTVKSLGTAPLNTVQVPVMAPKPFTEEERGAAATLIARLQEVQNAPTRYSAEHVRNTRAGAQGAGAADMNATPNPRSALEELLSRHSKTGLAGGAIQGKPRIARPTYIPPSALDKRGQ
ncbi:hypothetical protein PYCCODRAFT_1479171 [Trametes coccinea BRFM310]|uniref:Uncharacterized protein n=1 Tax=Trametes coccinea (strain BRFM310) TaxID=1353009 RepID=A0A1Y2IHA9_TRAC3|nr:hypothetical protein PYCCODRAFT_1479171 [Trametes coccinea BRFM310]